MFFQSGGNSEEKRHTVDLLFDQYSSDTHSRCFNNHGNFTSTPSPSADAIIIHDDQSPAKFPSNHNHIQVCGTHSLFGHSDPDIILPKRLSSPHGMDRGMMDSKFESSCKDCSTRHLEIQSSGQCLSNETRVGKMDKSFFDQNGSDALSKCFNDRENLSDFGSLRDQFVHLEDQDNGQYLFSGTRVTDSFFDQNSSDKSARCCKDFESLQDEYVRPEDQANRGSLSELSPVGETNFFFGQCDPEVSFKIPGQSRMFPTFPLVDFVPREQKSPGTIFQDRVADHFLGLGMGVEPPVDQCRSADDRDGEKPLLNFDKDQWVKKSHTRSVPEKLWPDDEPPEPPKRFRISPPNVEKSSSSFSFGFGIEKTPPSVSASMDFVMPQSNAFSDGSFSERNHPVNRMKMLKENTLEGCSQSEICDPRMFTNPQLSLYSSKAVSLMQSEEGLHVITEEMVAHTIFDDPPGDDLQNAAQNHHAVGCHSTGEQRDPSKYAGLSENPSARSDNRRPDNRIEEIILSPSSDTGTIVCRAPSRNLCSVGGTDWADIVGGWKPLCGQTVVRKPSRTAQNAIQTNSATGIRKVAKPPSDSLWTTFDGAAQKSGTCTQQVSGHDRFGIGKNDRGPLGLALPATLLVTRGAGVDNRTGHVTSYLPELSLPVTTAPVNKASIPDIRPDMVNTGSSGDKLESVRVWEMPNRNNNEYRHKSTNFVKNLVSLSSSEPLTGFELEGTKGGRPFSGSSSANRIEMTTVQKQRKRTLVDGCSDDVELASRNDSTSVNRFGAVGLSNDRSKSSFGERFGAENTEKNNICTDGCKNGCLQGISKWQKFQETDPTDQNGQSTSSSLVRTTGNGSFQIGSSYLVEPVVSSVHIISPDPVQHCEPPTHTSSSDLVGNKTTTSSLVRTATGHGPFQSEVRNSLPPPIRKPEVVCFPPQVCQPARALSLDQDTSALTSAERRV